MADEQTYVVQPFKRLNGELHPADIVRCDTEAQAFKRGKQMAERVAGAVFYRIETSASGDQWTEVEVLATIGDVPVEAA